MFQLFLSRLIPENLIIEFVQQLFQHPASSLNYESLESRLYVQYIEYEEDFPLSINISYSKDMAFNFTTENLGEIFAKHFEAEVLFELEKPIKDFEWKKINSKGQSYFVEIVDSERGIKVTSAIEAD
jgi:hypothetical protein